MPFAGKAYVEMGVTGQAAFKAAFAQMQMSVRQFQAGIQRIGGTAFRGVIGSLTTMRRMMTSLIGQATALGAAFGLSVGLKNAIDDASELEQTLLKFNVVFGDNANQMRAWAETFSAEMKRSRGEIMQFMAKAQSIVIPFGIDEAQVNMMSQSLTRLAYDLASLHNVQDAEAFEAMMAALMGETEPMKRFGVVVNETAVKMELLNQGLELSKASEAQKVMARFNIILRNTQTAQGDLERSGDSFENKLKELQAAWKETSAAIGSAFLPYATIAIDYIRKLIAGLDLNATAADNTARVFNMLGNATEFVAGALDIGIRGFALFRGALSTIIGLAATAADMFLDLFRLLANNPITRTTFGDDFVNQIDSIAGDVQKTVQRVREENRQAALQAFDTLTSPENLGKSAIDSYRKQMEEVKAAYEKEVEANKKAREEKLAEANQVAESGGEAAADAIRGAFQMFDREALAAYSPAAAPKKEEAQKEVKQAADRAVQVASPQSLEATAVGTFEKFRENAMNQQIALQRQQANFLQQIVRVLKDPQTAIMEFTT